MDLAREGMRVVTSMTGFAAGTGRKDQFAWSWDLRSVNAKGLDVRLRVPDWISGLEAGLREKLRGVARRGNITVSLRLQKDDDATLAQLNSAQLDIVLAAAVEVENRAMAMGLTLAPTDPAKILQLRGVLDGAAPADDTDALRAALLADFDTVAAGFAQMRAAEGTALDAVLRRMVDQIAGLTDQATRIADARKADQAAALRAALTRVSETISTVEPERVAQELAVLAVKSDITEELDRLQAHVIAARDLLADKGPVGRKLDFLMQEFNREANTLCSKSQHAELTSVGLELKVIIDQLREQVQNVE